MGKLKRLSEKGLNFRRQTILGKRIEKIKRQLISIKYSLTKALAVSSFAGGVAMLQPEIANAQNFQPPVVNPFLLNIASDSIGNITSVDYADLDADGDFDAMVYDKILNKIYLIKNLGTQELAEFGTPEELSISIPDNIGYGGNLYTQYLDNICLGDLDEDGDLDLMGGEYKGDFIYFENLGSANLPAYADGIENPFSLVNIRTNQNTYFVYFINQNSIEFADVDGDGDLDIFTKSQFYNYDPPNGYDDNPNSFLFFKTFYIENIGDNETPIFGEEVQTGQNGFSGFGDLADLDLDGDFDYITKTYLTPSIDNYGNDIQNGIFLRYVKNIGTIDSPQFSNVIYNPFGLAPIIENELFSPSIVDFDHDNDMDLMFLKLPNKFTYFENKLCDTNLTNAVNVEEHISLSAVQPDVQYQWYECNSNFTTQIEGATSQSFYPVNSGYYMVQINTGDCVLNSGCYENINCTELIDLTVSTYDGSLWGYSYLAENYQWLDCNDGYLPIEGETFQYFYPLSSGSYALEISSGTCKDTSACYEFDICASFSALLQYNGSSLSADQDNANYQWLDCNNGNLPLEGETNQVFIPSTSGSYSLNVSNSDCNLTSDCFEFDICASFSSEIYATIDTIIALQNNASYQWIDCDNGNLPIEGETNQIFSPPASGNYAINVSNANCNLTSDCFEYNVCDNVSTGVLIDNNSITAVQGNANYQWYNCDFGNYYADELNQTFEPISSGNYSCEIAIGNCNFTTDCIYFEYCENISTEIGIIGTTLFAQQDNASYQWIICTNPITYIVGENSQSYTPYASGSYAVLIDYNNCYIATDCFNLTLTGINNYEPSNQFSIIPNPTNGNLNIIAAEPLQNATIQIKSITGQIAFEQQNISGSQFEIDIANSSKGLYILEVTENGFVTRLKILKE